ncbi:ABC transporter substrate-binding protein [Hymenobacter baengnokdamensis]|uniref:ABC transporter substrate-binding protein n=1 Tax=Hymenobacter baengnokdamensis TaxID=2615203 RepID=UPI001782F24D|nr:ABC transporter substrate-binding protein [Hymenobacter baengnokdamensis]
MALPNQNAIDVANLLHVSLLQVDYKSNRYAPALAQSLPQVTLMGDSLTSLDYHLRPAAAWDNGQPVLATDVDFTLKLMQCPGLPNEGARAQFSFIRKIQLDPANPRHFTIVCRGQATELATASGDYPILPEAVLDPTHALRGISLAALQDWPESRAPAPAVAALVQRYQQADLARHPERLPGCGAYKLAVWETGWHLLLQRKAHWWADALRPASPVLQARPQQLDFVIIPDDAVATLALRRHELEVYSPVPARFFQRLQTSAAAQRELFFYSSPSYDIVTAGFNTRRAPLRDKCTRQAISRLFDPVALLKATQLGQGSTTIGLLPPTSPYYNDSLPPLTYAPARAVALLQQAGWRRQPDGTWRHPSLASPLTLRLRYRTDETTFATAALQLQAAAAQLGIPIVLVPTETSVLVSALRSGDFDMYIRLVRGSPFGFNFMPVLHSNAIGNGNFTGFGTPATDRLLEGIAVEGNERRKRLMLRKLQAVVREEMPLVPLFFLPIRLVASRRLQPVATSGLKPGYMPATLAWATADSLRAPAH